jgi:hypothetical protein
MSYQFNPFTGTLDKVGAGEGGGGTPGGADTQIQFNDDGSFGGSADLTWDDTSDPKVLTVGGDINLDDGGSFQTTLQLVTPTAARTITFPDATGTVGLVAGSTGQIVYNNAGAYEGTSITFSSTTGTRFTLPFGYGAGAGGTVTQATSKSTGVTLNTRCGTVTMNAAELAANTAVSFTLTNSQVEATDMVMISHSGAGTFGAYVCDARAAAGSASVVVRNVTAGALSEAIVLRFAIVKAVTS